MVKLFQHKPMCLQKYGLQFSFARELVERKERKKFRKMKCIVFIFNF